VNTSLVIGFLLILPCVGIVALRVGAADVWVLTGIVLATIPGGFLGARFAICLVRPELKSVLEAEAAGEHSLAGN